MIINTGKLEKVQVFIMATQAMRAWLVWLPDSMTRFPSLWMGGLVEQNVVVYVDRLMFWIFWALLSSPRKNFQAFWLVSLHRQ
mmetsp:Transcript_4448/g.4781  ORF Transcript_4448/g.4781 Transcript_4448/m.4781 type:complete len:83 (+) Transcript_4448:41-289(+)